MRRWTQRIGTRGHCSLLLAGILWIVAVSLRPANAAPAAVQELQDTLVKISEQLKPSVVNISSEQIIKRQGGQDFGDMFKNFPFGDMFPPFQMPRPRGGAEKEMSLGAGMIIREDGYILTNNHVVKDATSVKVVFDAGTDQPEAVPAKVVGSDEVVDIAILKINRKGLKPVELGDSDALQVGSLVVAIGSPYRFEHTVTFGVVSAKGRHLNSPETGSRSLQDYIQTDASINRGNSGGPLVDIDGKVIGINTAIWSPTGASIGIGFAVPINSVKAILPSLIKGEKIKRGWLGIQFLPLSKETAEMYGISNGFEVKDVIAGTPAEKAGIEKGDIIVEFDGKKLTSSEQLTATVATAQPGKSIKVKVLRLENDKVTPKELTVTLAVRDLEGGKPAATEMKSLLGLSVQGVTPESARRWNHPEDAKGVIVTEIDPGSPADEAGIVPGDLIVLMARKSTGFQSIRSLRDYNKVVANLKPGDRVLIRWQNSEGLVQTQSLTAREPVREKEKEKDQEND